MSTAILMLALFLQSPLYIADTQVAPDTALQHDGAAVHGTFDEARWKEIVGDTDYTERERKTGFNLPAMSWAGPLFKVISYVVIIGLVLWIFYYLITNIGFGAGIQRTAIVVDAATGQIENIETVDIETLLLQAKRDRNFRLAIRLYYLGILKKLHGRGVIGWKKDKTNRDYLAELYAKDFHYGEMRRLTLLYEAVWYGEHTPGAESFESLTERFETMYRKINFPETP